MEDDFDVDAAMQRVPGLQSNSSSGGIESQRGRSKSSSSPTTQSVQLVLDKAEDCSVEGLKILPVSQARFRRSCHTVDEETGNEAYDRRLMNAVRNLASCTESNASLTKPSDFTTRLIIIIWRAQLAATGIFGIHWRIK